MVMQWTRELAQWCEALSPQAVFFFSLPFIVAAVALLAQRRARA